MNRCGAKWAKIRAKAKSSITWKLILLFLVVSLIPVTLVQIINYYNTITVMERKVKEYASISLIQTARNIRTVLSAYEDLVYQVAYDDGLNALLGELNQTHDAVVRNKLQVELDVLSYSKKFINSLLLVTETGDYVISVDRSGLEIYHRYWRGLGDLTQTAFYRNSIQYYSANAWESTKLLAVSEGIPYYSFFLSRRMIDFNTNTPVGVVILSINESLLSNILSGPTPETRRGPDETFLVDDTGRIIAAPLKTLIGENIRRIIPAPDASKLLRGDGVIEVDSKAGRKDVIVYSVSISKTGWRLINVINRDDLFREIHLAENLMLLVEAIAVLLLLVMAIGLSKQLTASVKKIVDVMLKAQNGDLAVRVETKGQDEIAVIANSFNRMMEKIKALLEEVTRVHQKEKETELRMLEMQINPHFLYNTLDSINWMAIEKGEYEISDSLKKLAVILRYSVNNNHQIVTVRQEVEWLNNYLSLQKCRFSDSFSYRIDIEPELLECRIHKLLLQPFIENAIVHGLSGRKKGGVLEITGKRSGEAEMLFIIMDNGKGMSRQTIARVFGNQDKETAGIGVNNALSRLELYYKERYRLMVESSAGGGTTIQLTVPMNGEAEEAQ